MKIDKMEKVNGGKDMDSLFKLVVNSLEIFKKGKEY